MARLRGVLMFWAWGDDERETMAHLERTLANVASALRSLGVSADHTA